MESTYTQHAFLRHAIATCIGKTQRDDSNAICRLLYMLLYTNQHGEGRTKSCILKKFVTTPPSYSDAKLYAPSSEPAISGHDCGPAYMQ